MQDSAAGRAGASDTMARRRVPSVWLPRRGGSLRGLALIAIAVLAYAYGWRVTKIDLGQLVAGIPNVQHIALGLLRPDIVSRDVERMSATGPLRVGEGAPTTTGSRPGSAQLVITPDSIKAGQRITFEGSAFPPDSDGRLMLGHPTARSRPITAIHTDGQGRFVESFIWPEYAEDSYLVEAEVTRPLNSWQPSETLRFSLDKMIETVFLALIGTTFGVLFSLPLSFLGARNLMTGGWARAAYYAVRAFFNVTRSIEVLIVAVIMAVVVGIGPFAGVMALVIHSIGAMGKLYSEAIESIDPGPLEAITSTGANRLQVVLFGVIPQVIPQFIAFTMYRWDMNVRMSTVIGLVGGGGIGFLLIQYINLLQWNQAGTALWLIAIVVIAMDYASARLRESIV